MPHQNRVTPYSTLIATPERGAWFGNRGCLHNSEGRIRRHHRGTRWIYCVLQFRGRRRTLLQPGRYTELFFLDEATALAAGHRPCAECQRARFNEFCALWRQANPALAGSGRLTVATLDGALHAQRLAEDGSQRIFTAPAGDLPMGAFITLSTDSTSYVRSEHGWRPWSPTGYGAQRTIAPDQPVQVLTPSSVVRTLSLGFQPQIAG